MTEINSVVLEIGKINFEGNIIPHQWYHSIKTEKSGKTDLVAIIILAEIIYWYRPIERIDEKTGKVLPPRQKFSGNQFQCRYRYFIEKFGLTQMQVRYALDNLVKLGLITKTVVDRVTLKSGEILTNVMFVEPVPSEIARITGSIDNMPSVTGNIPSVTGNIPSVTGNIPSVTGNIPSVTGNIPSVTGNTPSVTGNIPSVTGNTPSVTGNIYTKTSSKTSFKTSSKTSFKKTDEDRQTTRTHAKSKNNANPVSQSSVDLNLSYLIWPKNLNQSQPIKVALLKLPSDQVRQQVLDVVTDASKKGTLKKPVAFLQKVVQNYLDGDFTPIEKSSTQTHVQVLSQEEQRSDDDLDAQAQSHSDRVTNHFREQEMIKELQSAFYKNRNCQVEKVMAGWDDETRKFELEKFKKTMGSIAHKQYHQHGLDSNLVKSALAEYVANNHLPLDESHFSTWAKKQGHEIESTENGGYRLSPTRSIGNILKQTLSKIEGLST